MTDLDNIKVARYMLEFGKKELLDAHGGFLRVFLQGWIKDSAEQIGIDGNALIFAYSGGFEKDLPLK